MKGENFETRGQDWYRENLRSSMAQLPFMVITFTMEDPFVNPTVANATVVPLPTPTGTHLAYGTFWRLWQFNVAVVLRKMVDNQPLVPYPMHSPSQEICPRSCGNAEDERRGVSLNSWYEGCTHGIEMTTVCSILASSLLYVVGLLAMTSRALLWTGTSSSKSSPSSSSLFWSLYLISLGQGGYNPSLQAFGADQLEHADDDDDQQPSSSKDVVPYEERRRRNICWSTRP
ncbi:hypothetical protein ACLOJK_038035 [Asimina triloba]